MIAAAVEAILKEMQAGREWWLRPALQAVFGGEARALGYAAGPDAKAPVFAFLAVDAGANRRALVLLKLETGLAMVSFDFGTVGQALSPAEPGLQAREVLSRKDEGQALKVLHFPHKTPPVITCKAIWNLDLAGVQINQRIILFHRQKEMARAAVFFDAAGPGKPSCLVAGLAPGPWQIWRNGYLEDSDAMVLPNEGVLFFEGAAGSYFLRPQ